MVKLEKGYIFYIFGVLVVTNMKRWSKTKAEKILFELEARGLVRLTDHSQDRVERVCEELKMYGSLYRNIILTYRSDGSIGFTSSTAGGNYGDKGLLFIEV